MLDINKSANSAQKSDNLALSAFANVSMEQHQAALAAATAAWDQVNRLHHGGPYPPIPMQQG